MSVPPTRRGGSSNCRESVIGQGERIGDLIPFAVSLPLSLTSEWPITH